MNDKHRTKKHRKGGNRDRIQIRLAVNIYSQGIGLTLLSKTVSGQDVRLLKLWQ